MAGTWRQLLKGPQSMNATGEVSIGQDEIRGYGQPGFHDVILRGDVVVSATSGGTVTAMTLTQRKAYLATLALDLRFETGGPNVAPSTSTDQENKFNPIQGYPLDQLRLRDERILRRDMDGLTDSTTGLAQSYTAGAVSIAFKFYASLGRVEQIEENEALFGVGPEMLELMRVRLRSLADGLKAYSTSLTTNSIQVTWKVLRVKTKGNWRMAAIPPFYRRFQPANTARDVKTLACLPIELVDRGAGLSSTLLGAFEAVTVGNTVVNAFPDTPTDVHASLLESINNAALTDALISADVTEVYAVGDTTVEHMRGGAVAAVQQSLNKQWDADLTGIPALNEAEALKLMRAIAAQGLKAGETYHFVNAASVASLRNLPSNLLPAMGLMYCKTTFPEAQQMPGYRVSADGTARVFFEPTYSALAMKQYAEGSLEGNQEKMAGAVNTLARSVPGTSVDVERGFPEGGDKGGPVSATYAQIRTQVQQDAAPLVAAARAASA